MSSAATHAVEHIVLIRVKDDVEPSKVNDMRSLATLDQVRHLTVGPVLRSDATTADLRFTHMLHSRYDSKEDLEAYNAHPRHLGAVRGSLFPICGDLMAVDWFGDEDALPPHPTPGSAIRVSFLKLKDGAGGEVKDEVLDAVRKMRGGGGAISGFSCGGNFSPEWAKGLSIASLAVFPGRKELEEVDPNEWLVKVREHLESVVVVDYVLPLE